VSHACPTTLLALRETCRALKAAVDHVMPLRCRVYRYKVEGETSECREKWRGREGRQRGR
jgi:hypothetical protein